VVSWIGSEPLELSDLRGRVVLVRWWTEGCPFCAASAPALNDFHARYGEQGLTVLGFYHHKAPGRPDPARVERYAKSLGFTFPLAIDPAWQTLRQWWLVQGQRRFTSVTFLLDRQGVIRHIHPGGQYIEGDESHRALREAIETLLAEPAGS
jgi:peroxiredoxin